MVNYKDYNDFDKFLIDNGDALDRDLERIGFKVCFRDIDVQLAQAAKDLMSLSIRAA